MTKTIKEKIFTTLVTNGYERTPAQLATQAKTSEHTVRSTISRIRDMGFMIYANVKKDRQGNEKVVYRHGNPTKAMLETGYR